MSTKTTYRAYSLNSFSVSDIKENERNLVSPLPHQVVIRVKAVSLNFRDLLVARGHYNPNLPLPAVPTSDGAGEIVEVGSAVKTFKVGDRVSPNFMPEWHSGRVTPAAAKGALGGFVDGMLQEYKVLDELSLVKIPDHLSYEEAATLPCAALTAWNGLFVNGDLKPGQTVLTMGTGGVSIFALQLAKMAGARVISTSSSEAKLERLKELGADETINYKSQPNWDEAVLKLTDGVGVDHVVEVGGAGTLERSVKAVRFGGHVSVIGVLAGVQGSVSPLMVIMKAAALKGVFVGSRTMFEEMNAAIALHKLKPVIDRYYKAEQIVEALAYMESGQHFGKIVLSL